MCEFFFPNSKVPKMYPDIFLALLGHTGEVIVATNSEFRISPRVRSISHAEIELVNRIVKCGYLFKSVENFIGQVSARQLDFVARRCAGTQLDGSRDLNVFYGTAVVPGAGSHRVSHESPSSRSSALVREVQPGLFAEAMCSCVEGWLNKIYRPLIADLERSVAVNPDLPLVRCFAQLQPALHVLKKIVDLIAEIQSHGLRGGELLDCVWKRVELLAGDEACGVFAEILYRYFCFTE